MRVAKSQREFIYQGEAAVWYTDFLRFFGIIKAHPIQKLSDLYVGAPYVEALAYMFMFLRDREYSARMFEFINLLIRILVSSEELGVVGSLNDFDRSTSPPPKTNRPVDSTGGASVDRMTQKGHGDSNSDGVWGKDRKSRFFPQSPYESLSKFVEFLRRDFNLAGYARVVVPSGITTGKRFDKYLKKVLSELPFDSDYSTLPYSALSALFKLSQVNDKDLFDLFSKYLQKELETTRKNALAFLFTLALAKKLKVGNSPDTLFYEAKAEDVCTDRILDRLKFLGLDPLPFRDEVKSLIALRAYVPDDIDIKLIVTALEKSSICGLSIKTLLHYVKFLDFYALLPPGLSRQLMGLHQSHKAQNRRPQRFQAKPGTRISSNDKKAKLWFLDIFAKELNEIYKDYDYGVNRDAAVKGLVRRL